MTRGRAHPVVRALWLAVWAGLGLYLAYTLWLGLGGLTYPYQLDYGEGIVLWFAQQLSHGHSIYKGLTGLPYASSNYPPLSMLLVALLLPLFGQGYTAGRLLNFSAGLLVAALIFRIVMGEVSGKPGANRRSAVVAAALAALLFIGSPYIYGWIPLFRADLIGLFFAFAGMCIIWTWERHRLERQSALYLGGALGFFLLALYTKQTLLAAPAAALFAIFRRNGKHALAFAAALLALFGVVYVLIDYATGGGFTFGLITSNATVFLPDQLARQLASFAGTFAIMMMLALVEIVRRVRNGLWGVLDLYAAFTIAALVMAGRVGAWENYFFEAIAALAVLTGLALGSLEECLGTSVHPLLRQVTVPILLLVQVGLMWHEPSVAVDLMARGLRDNQALAALLARTPGMVISEDMGALATSGKPVVYYTFQYSSLARSGQWDQSWELAGLRDGTFALVVLEQGTREDVDHYGRFTREFVSALDHYYARVDQIGRYQVYAYSPVKHLQAADFGDSISMVGWDVEPPSLDGGAVRVTVIWQAKRAMSQRYTSFVHVEDGAGTVIGQDDHEPHMGNYPTSRWGEGEMVRETYLVELPKAASAEKRELRVGWYGSEDGERLAVMDSPDDTVRLELSSVARQ